MGNGKKSTRRLGKKEGKKNPNPLGNAKHENQTKGDGKNGNEKRTGGNMSAAKQCNFCPRQSPSSGQDGGQWHVIRKVNIEQERHGTKDVCPFCYDRLAVGADRFTTKKQPPLVIQNKTKIDCTQ